MNAIAVTNQTFTIAETVINMVDGLYSLNDLHKASGNIEKHRPAFFIRNQEVTELAEEIMQCANLHSDQVIRKV
ncbi:KilA-N domain-containing protein, partial [Mycobacterium tuberculosis]|nr:KilA-N domain-containing protein [Mycobacterium tuberculosis]